MTEHGGSEVIELVVPSQPAFLQLLRLAAGAVAARADFDLDHVEDLRLAVDELCLPFLGARGDGARLYVRYEWGAQMLDISCVLGPGANDGAPTGVVGAPVGPRHPITGAAKHLRDELSSQILDALVDEHGEMTVDGHPGVWLRMRGNGAAGA